MRLPRGRIALVRLFAICRLWLFIARGNLRICFSVAHDLSCRRQPAASLFAMHRTASAATIEDMPQPLRPALFLDRDGVINEETGYLHRFEDVCFVTGAADLVRTANALDMPVIVITNQAGIGRGLYTEAQFHLLMRSMRDALLQENARLDAVYFSPFHPEHGLGEYRRDTECRKPRPGMLLRAAAEHAIVLTRSVLVGDRCSDIQAGAAAGVPYRFLLRGTEPGPCTSCSYMPVDELITVTRWLAADYPRTQASSEPDQPMQPLRDILRNNLRTSLQALTPLDRLAAAWPVVAGHAIAERSEIVRLEGTQAAVEVRDPAWLPELRANTPRLTGDLARVSGVAVADILFFAAPQGTPAHGGPRNRPQ